MRENKEQAPAVFRGYDHGRSGGGKQESGNNEKKWLKMYANGHIKHTVRILLSKDLPYV